MNDKGESRLKRLREEHTHTQILLKSPRLKGDTRRILEALLADLKRQIDDLSGESATMSKTTGENS